jgi:methyl-accepting chemotaxis protein
MVFVPHEGEEGGKEMGIKGKILMVTGIIVMLTIGSIVGYQTIGSIDTYEKIIAYTMISQLDALSDEIQTAEHSVQSMQGALDEKNILLARSIAMMIERDQSLLGVDAMVGLRESLGVDEIHVTDERGVIVSGTVSDFYGFDFRDSEQTRPFLDLIDDQDGALAQAPAPRGVDDVLFQYIGVNRIDAKGIVQIGIEPTAVQQLIDRMNVQRSIEKASEESDNLAFLIGPDHLILHHPDESMIGAQATEYPWIETVLSTDHQLMPIELNNRPHYAISSGVGDQSLVMTFPRDAIQAMVKRTLLQGTIGIVVAILILILAINGVIGRWVVRPLRDMEEKMSALGSGDLTVSMDYSAKDEIGSLTRHFTGMIASIRDLIRDSTEKMRVVSELSENIHAHIGGLEDASNEVTLAVDEIAGGSTETADNIARRLSDAKDLGEIIRTASGQMTSGRELMDHMLDSSRTGRLHMTKLETVFSDTTHRTHRVVEQVDLLHDRSQEIEEIIRAIKGISGQTNLLALNASIEAARAGESGRGFAVVAEEIRKLAEESTVSSERISNLVSEIIKLVEDTKSTADHTKVSVGTAQVSLLETTSEFDRIEGHITRMNGIVSTFQSTTEQMDRMKEELLVSFESMAAISEEVAASTEEIHASTEEQLSSVTEVRESIYTLDHHVTELSQKMHYFKV